ncbi:hypothetical protein EXIGLDRAFT_665230 [Exidia glandulosa HHB12029]|uniref:C2H2-type domain-containing protein n=1 Tax=Exidia glandulosa HHB12029 TaxID=1314781 RepID=A0A165PU24_EXIGL|nr:hypothetical protein EXIGLDRAFT_665230 [Exidia glandulosa HHB12029]
MAPWTSSEDEQLLNQIAIHGTKDRWRQIAEAIPGRTNKACRKRWLHSLCPDVKKSLWTESEDEKLVALHKLYPGRWAVIARHIDGRTDDACSKRYREALDPTLVRGEWSPDDDKRLLREVANWKSQWSKVGHAMNRSGLGCRNRFRMLQRKMDAPAQILSPPLIPQWQPESPAVETLAVTPPSTDSSTIELAWPQQQPYHYAHPNPLVVPEHSPWDGPSNASTPVFAIDPNLQQHSHAHPHPALHVDLHVDQHLGFDSNATSAVTSPHDHESPDIYYPPIPSQHQSMNVSYLPSDLHDIPHAHAHAFYDDTPSPPPVANDDLAVDAHSTAAFDVVPAHPTENMLDVCMQASTSDLASSSISVGSGSGTTNANVEEDSAPPPAKRRRTTTTRRRRVPDADTARLSATRSVTADSSVLAYACGHARCWPALTYRFATSAELLAHKKEVHADEEDGLGDDVKIYRCALPGCNKAWKNINGLQYHLQVSRAHFQIAVNRAKQSVSADHPGPGPERQGEEAQAQVELKPQKQHRCPHDGCPNSYKQLSGLRYHLTHGHPENAPAQLDELPPQLKRKLAVS